MNKFKLFALAVCAMLSTNAFAEETATNYVVKDGLIYKVLSEAAPATATEDAKPATVELAGIADNTKGKAFNTSKTISVPAAIEVTVDDEEKDYNVVSIAESWEAAEIAKPKSLTTLSTVIETLSIDITNFSAKLEYAAYDGFSKLASLKIVDNTEVTEEKAAVTTELPDVNPTVTTLDFAETNITKMPLFKNNATIVTVKLSKAMKVIPIDEFYGASKLKTVVLPTNLETISGGAFQECAALEGTFEIPATVKEIRKYAFLNAAKADIDLSKAAALELIGEGAFQGSGITTANLNASVKLTTIGKSAFCAENLAKLQMSGLSKGKLETIGERAFAGTKITAANIPATVTTLGEGAFAGCEELTTLSKMAGLLAIPANAFKGDVKLASVSINENVAAIGASAFEGCKALATVTIMTDEETGESDLAEIGDLAFAGCEKLESIDLSATKITEIQGNKKALFLGCKALKEVKVPATLEKIVAQAFGDCVIENLDLSETAITRLNAIFRYDTDIYPSAKKPYASLKSITLPEGLTEIYDYSTKANAGVFQYCTGLTEITIPESVTVVPSLAFQYCTALETATVSDGKVDAKAFWYCDKLKTFNYLDTDITNDEGETAKYVLNDAFLGCTPFIKFVTTGTYQKAHPTAPTNTKYGTSANATMKTVWEGVEGAVKAYGIFENTTGLNVIVKKSDDLKLYSIYVDEGTAYFQALKFVDGQFVIAPNAHVILKTDAPKDNIEYTTATPIEGERTSVLIDEVVSLNWGGEKYGAFGGITTETYPLAEFQSDYVGAGEYVYRLTNNGGFGFKFFTGTEMKAGQFFIVSTKAPTSAARLQTVWLDEDGNVEGDATGIQQVDAAEAQDGAIYNLQGVRVNAAKKGLYIQNGKKFIVK